MKRKYFVSYSHKNGFGNADITVDRSINQLFNSYKVIQEEIQKHNQSENVILLNYKRIWWWNKWL